MRKTLLILALVAFVGGLVAAFVVWGRDAGTAAAVAVPPPRSAPAPQPKKKVELATPSPEGARPEREVAKVPAPQIVPGPSRVVEHVDMTAHVRGRFIDEAGLPIASVGVRDERESASAKSGADGRFELSLELAAVDVEQRVTLVVSCVNHATREIETTLEVGATIDLGDVVLEPGGVISGRVVDELGRGYPGAEVSCTILGPVYEGWKHTGPINPQVRGKSDERGSFRLEGVRAGMVRAWAGEDGKLWAYSEGLEVRAGEETTDVELKIEPLPSEDMIEMVVLDPSGKPIPHAEISYSYRSPSTSGSGSTSADGHGRYRHLLPLRVPHDFEASDPDRRFRSVIARDVAPGTLDLELRLKEKRYVALNVRDTSGAPVESYRANAIDALRQNQLQVGLDASEHPGGIAQVLLPAVPFSVTVDADGYSLGEAGPFDPDRPPPSIDVLVARLPGVHGRVSAGGKPVAGAEVGLHEAIPEEEEYSVNDFPCRSTRNAISSATTDEDGRFALTLRDGGNYFVRAEKSAYAPTEVGPLELVPVAGASDLELALGSGGAIEGKVILPHGADAGDVIVGISRADGFGQTQRAAADGSFRFEQLAVGRWLVERRADEIRSSSTTTSRGGHREAGSIPWSCEVHEGATTHFDLDLLREMRSSLEGTLALGNRSPAEWSAVLSPRGASRQQSGPVPLDARGRFEIALARPGPCTLFLSRNGVGGRECYLQESIELQPGANEWELALPVGRIEGHAAAPLLGQNSRLMCTWHGRGDLQYFAWITTDASGDFTLSEVPAGDATFSHYDAEGARMLQSVSVPAGETAKIELQ